MPPPTRARPRTRAVEAPEPIPNVNTLFIGGVGREGGKEGGREGGKERGREGGKEGGREGRGERNK